jgi:hypothetical protein
VPYRNGQFPTEVLWRTLIADTADGNYPATPEYHIKFLCYIVFRALMVKNQAVKRHPFDDFRGDETLVQTLSAIESLGAIDPKGLNAAGITTLISTIGPS